MLQSQLPPGCVMTSKDDFLVEEATGFLYKCSGNQWVRVEWSHIQADDATNQEAGCAEGEDKVTNQRVKFSEARNSCRAEI